MADSANDGERPGYKQPPKEHQFKPGQSGNPRGRPKRQPSTADEFRKVLAMPVTVEEGGKKRKIPTQRALFMQMRRAALGGDARARRDFLELMERHAPQQLQQGFADMIADDERLIAEFRAKIEARSSTEGGAA